MLALQTKALPARDDERRPRDIAETSDLVRDVREEMLGVVEQEQRPLPVEPRRDRVREIEPGQLLDGERVRERRHDVVRAPERCERHPPDAVRIGLGRLGHGMHGEARLAGSTGAREGQQPHPGLGEEHRDGVELAPAAEEGRRGDREVRAVEAPQRRELAIPELEDPLGCREILEAVLPQVPQREILVGASVVDERSCRRGHEHLPAVSRGCNAGRTVDVRTHVSLCAHHGSPRVDAQAQADRPGLEALDDLPRRPQRLGRGGEGDEEGVSLRVDLDAAVLPACLAHDAAVLLEKVGKHLSAYLVEQLRRALDVREEECDGARREITHSLDDAPRRAGDQRPGALLRRCRSRDRRTPQRARNRTGQGHRDAASDV